MNIQRFEDGHRLRERNDGLGTRRGRRFKRKKESEKKKVQTKKDFIADNSLLIM